MHVPALHIGQCTEAIVLNLVNPVSVGEGLRLAQPVWYVVEMSPRHPPAARTTHMVMEFG